MMIVNQYTDGCSISLYFSTNNRTTGKPFIWSSWVSQDDETMNVVSQIQFRIVHVDEAVAVVWRPPSMLHSVSTVFFVEARLKDTIIIDASVGLALFDACRRLIAQRLDSIDLVPVPHQQ